MAVEAGVREVTVEEWLDALLKMQQRAMRAEAELRALQGQVMAGALRVRLRTEAA